jgi:hypothetical protein
VRFSARTYLRKTEPFQRPLLEKLVGGEASALSLSVDSLILPGESVPRFTGEFWTSRQRQASSLHEVSYRACFKPHLPRFFIDRFTDPGDVVYDPFMGRGTTVVEAALRGRTAKGNDVNPLSRILARPRINPPREEDVERRIALLKTDSRARTSVDLSMFYHPRTEAEIVSLRQYLIRRKTTRKEDDIDRWIRMIATNRLTGHSKGFFSVYTLPPNQAMSPDNQKRINRLRKQKPEYRDVRELIVRKSRSLLRNLQNEEMKNLKEVSRECRFTTCEAWKTVSVANNSVQLTVTSPPFLDTVNYAQDNWLRCWFNALDLQRIEQRLTVVRSLEEWTEIMGRVFQELFRITVAGGVVAFEVGEIRKRNLRLDEVVVPIGIRAGFRCVGIIINQQRFTKTSNIWGISNNRAGTNTNRIVVFHKSHWLNN